MKIIYTLFIFYPVLTLKCIRGCQYLYTQNLKRLENPESTELKVSLLQNTWAFDYIYRKESCNQDILVQKSKAVEMLYNTVFEFKNVFKKVSYDKQPGLKLNRKTITDLCNMIFLRLQYPWPSLLTITFLICHSIRSS